VFSSIFHENYKMRTACYLPVILICMLLSSWVCSQETIIENIMHDGIEREYMVYVPASYDSSEEVPLILNFHGYGSNAIQQLVYGDFRAISDREGFILVVPEGTFDLIGNAHWNVGWGASTVDDVAFVSTLIDQLVQDYAINEERIYSTGMSNGGFISYELACQLSDRIAAIASVTGSMSLPTFQNCNPNRPIPVLQIHGTADNTVLYDGSSISTSIDQVMEYWVNHNNCDIDPVITAFDDIDMTDQSTVERIVWENGDMGVTTELYLVENGGHSWPGAVFNIPITNYDINASEEIWKFFSRFDINGEIQLSSLEDSSIEYEITISPNPASEYIQLCWDWDQSRTLNVAVHDTAGRLVLSNAQHSNCLELDITPLNKGVYFVKIIDPNDGKSLTRKLIKT